MHNNTPLYNQLLKHLKNNPISFHVPGHKMGKGFDSDRLHYFEEILKIDQTEITGLDDLHYPEGVILESEKNTAKVFRADRSFYLVNGSTSGILAMILSVCAPGDKVILPRNAHKSVINGLIFARAIPIYLGPEFISELEIVGGISYNKIKTALETHPDAKAVFLTNPNYYGVGMELHDVVELVHSYHIPLLVDEAHGAHFGFHPVFPHSAIQMGADMVVQSTHKTLTAMTMGSMLHVKSNLVDTNRVKFFLNMVTTSSPSYPIMVSLEIAAVLIKEHGYMLWDVLVGRVDRLYKELSLLRNLRAIREIGNKYIKDPLKVIIQSRDNRVSGFEIQRLLEKKKIYTELADYKNTLIVLTLGNKIEEIDYLLNSLIEIDHHIEKQVSINPDKSLSDVAKLFDNLMIGSPKISIEKVLYGKTKLIPLEDAIHKISAEMIVPYPPGIPIINIGEMFSEKAIEYLLRMIKLGGRINGVYVNKVRVLDIDSINTD